MADVLVSLRAKIAECKPKLEAAQRKGAAIFKAVSTAQSQALGDLLQRSKLSSNAFNQERAEILDLLIDCSFGTQDLEYMCRYIETAKPTTVNSKHGKQLSQDFVNFHLYMPVDSQPVFGAQIMNQ
jgi:hypothetical protein